MMKAWQRAIQYLAIALLLVVATALFSSCGNAGSIADPTVFGFDKEVIYNAMGGLIGQREIRQTYYAEGSFLFEPSGTTGFVVEPKKEGYILAGWYTNFTQVQNDDETVSYVFDPQDRWDFNFDRAYADSMTLYAYWLPKSMVQYIHVMPDGTEDLFFTKEITAASGVIALEPVLENMSGHTLFGYYQDPACTVAHDFTAESTSATSIPTEQDIFDALALQFPDAFETISLEEVEEAKKLLQGGVQTAGVDEEDMLAERDPYLFIQQYGYRLVGVDPEIVAEIQQAHRDILGAAIAVYAESTESVRLYMKYIEGNYRRVRSVDELLMGGAVSMAGKGYDGYIIMADLDFTGYNVKPDSFSGIIYGNGHTISGLDFDVRSGKSLDDNEFANLGFWTSLTDAKIYDLNFADCTLTISESSNSAMYVAFLAGYASNVNLYNCRFENILIRTIRPLALKSPRLAIVGDLFAVETDVKLTNCPLINCNLEISGTVQATSNNAFGGIPEPEPDDIPDEP